VALQLDAVDAAVERLRQQDPPVIARVHEGRLQPDPRTVRPAEEDALVRACAALVGA
jgi:L-seryl-tRNA(Ser) seleniumtransferase